MIPEGLKKNTKSKSLKCRNCAWSTAGARKRPNVIFTMRRLYVRERGKWHRVGWFCKQCGSVVFDEFNKPISWFCLLPPPEPKIAFSPKCGQGWCSE